LFAANASESLISELCFRIGNYWVIPTIFMARLWVSLEFFSIRIPSRLFINLFTAVAVGQRILNAVYLRRLYLTVQWLLFKLGDKAISVR